MTGIDHRLSFGGMEITDRNDPAAAHGHVGTDASAICDHGAAANDQVVVLSHVFVLPARIVARGTWQARSGFEEFQFFTFARAIADR